MRLRSNILVLLFALGLSVQVVSAQEIFVEIVDVHKAHLVIAGHPSLIEFPMAPEELLVVEEAFRSYYKVHARNPERLLAALTFLAARSVEKSQMGRLLDDVYRPLVGHDLILEQAGYEPDSSTEVDPDNPMSYPEMDDALVRRLAEAADAMNWEETLRLHNALLTKIENLNLRTSPALEILWIIATVSLPRTENRLRAAELLKSWLQADPKEFNPFDDIHRQRFVTVEERFSHVTSAVFMAWVNDSISDEGGKNFLIFGEPLSIDDVRGLVDFAIHPTSKRYASIQELVVLYIESQLHTGFDASEKAFVKNFGRVIFEETTAEDARALLNQLARLQVPAAFKTLWAAARSEMPEVKKGGWEGLTQSPLFPEIKLAYSLAIGSKRNEDILRVAWDAIPSGTEPGPGLEIVSTIIYDDQRPGYQAASLLGYFLERAHETKDLRILSHFQDCGKQFTARLLAQSKSATGQLIDILADPALTVDPLVRAEMIWIVEKSATFEPSLSKAAVGGFDAIVKAHQKGKTAQAPSIDPGKGIKVDDAARRKIEQLVRSKTRRVGK